MMDDLRQEADLLLHRDGHVEEGIPGGNGAGMLQIPPLILPDVASSTDLPIILADLYNGGARPILIAGDTRLARRLHDANLIDRTVVGVERRISVTPPSPALGYRIEAVAALRGSIRIISSRGSDATVARIDVEEPWG
jgi:diaminohydroxyphosphoribosylaminopyrimidine deaminase/5-amino-6-(5-phosphoribosylamino)uracil reductase